MDHQSPVSQLGMTRIPLLVCLLAVVMMVSPSTAFKCANGVVTKNTYGMTWALSDCPKQPAMPNIGVGCHGMPRTFDNAWAGACNPYVGDTNCCALKQIMCYKPTGAPIPPGLEGGGTDYYQGWAPGIISATRSYVRGYSLTSVAVANAFCARELGAGYRMIEFHDGNNGQGGWGAQAIQAAGQNNYLSFRGRFWAYNNDANANCWDSPNSIP